MAYTDLGNNRDRIKASLGTAALQALLGYALLTGLGFKVAGSVHDELQVFDVAPDIPPPPVEEVIPAKDNRKDPEGAAAPPNLKADPTEIVVPPPEIRLDIPPPIVAAPIARLGSAPSAGATDLPGPGTGAGGQGNGTGSGSQGNGTGGGGGGSPLRWIRGSIRDSDYPRAALEAGIGGTVYLRFIVGTDGRVTSCTVTRSSGNRDLDAATCRLIKERFRYKPKRDAQGRAIPDTVTGEHVWATERRMGPPIEEEEPADDPAGYPNRS